MARERLPRDRRRALLLDATLELCTREGLTGLTVEAVARAGGVTRPVIYSLFGDLDGLLRALVDREEARALAALADVVPADPGERRPDDVLVDGIRAFLTAVRREPRTWRLVLLPPQGGPPALRERIAADRGAVAARIAELLDWGVPRRGGPTGLDHPVLARLLIAAAEDAARLVLARPARWTPDRLADAARELLVAIPAGAAP